MHGPTLDTLSSSAGQYVSEAAEQVLDPGIQRPQSLWIRNSFDELRPPELRSVRATEMARF
jgi:hypothetical protein